MHTKPRITLAEQKAAPPSEFRLSIHQIAQNRCRLSMPDAGHATHSDAARPLDSFDAVVAENRGRVFGFLLKKVGDQTAAEELAQETFVEAYRNRERFQGRSKVSTWLFGIALNRARNYLNRAPERRYRFVSDDAAAPIMDGADSPLERVLREERVRHVRAALDQLPGDLREALVLISMESMSYDEAGEALGIPSGTVKSRVFRARKQLLLLLSPYEEASVNAGS